MTAAAVIVAGGAGLRAGGERPKQYQRICGQPVIWWTLKAFCEHPRITHVQPVIGEGHEAYFAAAAAGLRTEPPVIGGATRQESCRIGIEALGRHALKSVLIHDAARPFVSPDLISAVIAALDHHGGAVPGLAVTETLKRAPDGRIAETVDRQYLWVAQTPQGFAYEAIREAHQRAWRENMNSFTDDAAVAAFAGIEVAMLPGRPENWKLTTEEDIARAERAMTEREFHPLTDIRVGQGIDIHAFAPGDHVMLCGVRIPHSQRLEGHSDADAALHALTDAILGAIGEGDIGTHFPPSDEQWKGAASEIFLARAVELVSARRGRVAHVDITILCEAPRIAPHIPAMKSVLGRLLGLGEGRIAIKATTTERLGFTGRGEGLAAFATATVRLPG